MMYKSVNDEHFQIWVKKSFLAQTVNVLYYIIKETNDLLQSNSHSSNKENEDSSENVEVWKIFCVKIKKFKL